MSLKKENGHGIMASPSNLSIGGKGQPAGSNGFNFLVLDGKLGKWADTTDFSGKVKGYICEWKGSAPKNAGPKDKDLKPPADK